MHLTNIQSSAVEKILGCFSQHDKVKVDFKAPTGSGKTFMATHFISSLIERNIGDQFVFVIATPSSSDLPLFFEQKINQYKKDLPFSNFDVEYIESPSSSKDDRTESTPKLIPQINKVYIFGKSTFGKGRIYTERNIIEDFVQMIRDRNIKLIYIRDEAHIGGRTTNDDETKRFEDLMQRNAHFVINMTATPNYNSDSMKVIMKESWLNDPKQNDNKWLLKTKLTPLLNKDISDDDLLIDAINKFKVIKSEYRELENNGVLIRPAMLIQVDNEPTRKDEKENFLQSLVKIKRTLSESGLSWVQYFGDSDKDSDRVFKERFTLDEITKIDNDTDVVIFKIGPSTGWDIPRACVLLQLRNVSSNTLNTQTIGRIKRNPFPNLERNDITDKYYVYSNAPKIDDNMVVYSYSIKDELIYDDLAVIKISNKRNISKSESLQKTRNDLNAFLVTNKSRIVQYLKTYFVENAQNRDVFRKERLSANQHTVYVEVKNVFMLLKEIELLLDRNENIFRTYKSTFDTFYEKELKGTLIYRNVLIEVDHLYIALALWLINDIKDIIRKNSPFIPTYKVELQQYEPQKYVQVYDGQVLESSTSNFDNYLFKIKKNDIADMLQPLDSGPELTVFSFLSYEIYKLDKLVKVWAKNLSISNVYGEYIDDNQVFRFSYFDFIIKFSNGSFLYIEVKSDEDIDPTKTELLERSYTSYFENKEQTLFDHPIVIVILKVSGNTITQKPFYDKNQIKIDLENSTLKELMNEVSML